MIYRYRTILSTRGRWFSDVFAILTRFVRSESFDGNEF